VNYTIIWFAACAAITASIVALSPASMQSVYKTKAELRDVRLPATTVHGAAGWRAALRAALPPSSHITYGFALTGDPCAPVVAAYRAGTHGALIGLACHDGAYNIIWRHQLGQRRPLEFVSSAFGVPHFLATWEAKSGAVTIVGGRWSGAFESALACGNHLCATLHARHGIEVFGSDHFIVATATVDNGVLYTWEGTTYRVASDQRAYAPNQRVVATVDSGQKAVAIDLVGVAAMEDQQELGLMDVRYLAPYAGMLFQFAKDTTTAFWMKDTLIPLSIAFISADGRILDIQDMQALDDRTLHYACGAQHPCPYRYAIEANKGFFTAHGIATGAHVTFSPRQPSELKARAACRCSPRHQPLSCLVVRRRFTELSMKRLLLTQVSFPRKPRLFPTDGLATLLLARSHLRRCE
jgi:uncharacterized membrane protein (UPF0127 family)